MGRPWYEHMLYPEWMLHNEDYDDIRRQEAKTSSLESRVNRLEDQVRDLQAHIRGLEALLSTHGIVPPAPEESASSEWPHHEPAVFPQRTTSPVTCPRCKKSQRGDRNLCLFCELPFRYKHN